MKFNNIKDTDINGFGDFELIPKGVYDLMITRAEEKIAQKSGNAYILLGLRVMNDDPTKSYKGRYVWTNINGSDIGLKILKSILVYNTSPLAEVEGNVEIDPSSLVGMKVQGRIGTEKDQNGDLRNKVGFFQPVSEEYADYDETYFEESVGPNSLASTPSANNESLPF